MALRFGGSKPPPRTGPLTSRELVDKYSGVGLQFRVKFVGSENVSRKRGDAEAAKYCIPTLKIASQQSKIHKPRAALGLSLKGISVYDENTKNVTRVSLEKVTYVSHDPVDPCYIGIIMSDKESHTGFKLHCFKAEKPVAVCIVDSSRELFELMYKLRQAKKKIKEEKEKAEQQAAAGKSDPDHSNLPAENAPPPSYISVSNNPKTVENTEQGPPERPPPPLPVQPPQLPPRPENEVPFSLNPPPSNTSVETSAVASTTNKPEPSLFSGFEDLRLDEPIVSQPTTTANFSSQQAFGMQQQPFSSTMNQPFAAEPSITMDLMDAIKNPVAGTTSYNYNPMGMGMGGSGGMGMGGSGGMGMGGPGMGMGMGGPGMGMGMGGPGMGMGMGGPGMGMGGPSTGNPFSSNQGFGFGQQTPSGQQDIFSMPADPMMDSGFNQPLQPANIAPQMGTSSTATSKPQQFDAFSGLADLVNIAKTNVNKKSPPPPRYSTIYDSASQKETTDSGAKAPNLLPSLPETAPPTLASLPQTMPSLNTQLPSPGNLGSDDFWNSDFGGGTSTAATTQQQTPTPTQDPWVSF